MQYDIVFTHMITFSISKGLLPQLMNRIDLRIRKLYGIKKNILYGIPGFIGLVC